MPLKNYFTVCLSLLLILQIAPPASSNDGTTSTKVKSNFRLPKSLKPLHYHLILQPFVNGNKTIKGYVAITLDVLEETSKIIFHIKDIITKNETVQVTSNDQKASLVPITNQTFDLERDFYIAHLDSNLTKGNQYIIKMDYEGILRDDLKGFYTAEYEDKKTKKKRQFAATQFQPTHARKAFPCFDEPGFRSTFLVQIIREDFMNSLSAMAKINTQPMKDQPGWYIDTFKNSSLMPTYLNAFVVSQLVDRTLFSKGDIAFRVFARDDVIDQAEYALRIGLKILHYFEDYFQIPYPFIKLDSVALPSHGGGMENWGLILYREIYLLYDPETTSASDKQLLGDFIAHELAHMWFGNLVTPDWWNGLWLSEGFASHMQTAGLTAAEPEYRKEEQFVASTWQSALELDSLASSNKINQEVGHPDEISDIFNIITYRKGSSVLRMLENILSESTFKKGVINYLKAFAYSNAVEDNLWSHLTAVAHSDQRLSQAVTVKEIMNSWTLKMGYPVVTVTAYNNGSALLTQKRFLSQGDQTHNDTIKYTWWIPITFTSQANANFEKDKLKLQWMRPSEEKKLISGMPLDNGWVIFNIGNIGFFRVNYDETNWRMLISQLLKDHQVIHPLNRIQIISDAFNLPKAGLLHHSIPLELSMYLKKERDYPPLKTAFDVIKDLADKLKGQKDFSDLKSYALSLIGGLYSEIGFADDLTEPHLRQLTRSDLLKFACYFGHMRCLEDSLRLYNQWMSDPSNDKLISPNVKKTVVCYAIRRGGVEQWNFALDRYQQSNVVSDANILISGLGCTRNETLLKTYMKMAFNKTSGIKTQDVLSAISSIASEKEGGLIVWDHLTKNLHDVLKRFDTVKRVAYIVKFSTRFFNTPQELEMVKQFRESNVELQGPGTRSIDNAIEEIEGRIEFAKNNIPSIRKWFKEQKQTKGDLRVNTSFTSSVSVVVPSIEVSA